MITLAIGAEASGPSSLSPPGVVEVPSQADAEATADEHSTPEACASVQAAGVVLVCRDETCFVEQVSANVRDLLGLPPERVLGRSLADVFEFADARRITGRRPWEVRGHAGRILEGSARPLGKGFLVELEPRAERPAGANAGAHRLRRVADACRGAGSKRQLLSRAAAEIRRLIGFEGVQAWGYDAHGTLALVAESGARAAPLAGAAALEPSPWRAHGLAQRRLQFIRDARDEPVPLIGFEQAEVQTASPLAQASLLASPPAQVKQLRRLGITSYLALPLLVTGKLVAQIILYHTNGVRPVPLRARAALERAAKLLSKQLEVLEGRERLTQENRRLSEVAQAKDEFIATLSHELRNQLHVVHGWMTLLKSGNLSAERSERALQVVDRSLLTQRKLLEDLLDLSAAVQGRLALNLQSLDLARLVREALDECAPALEAKGLELECDLGPNPSPVWGDSDRLRQVLLNLLANAIKFTPPGGGIRVSARSSSRHVQLSVSDSGIGILEEFLPQVFEAFRQPGSKRKERSGGFGMGLAIVKHLVELHGGKIVAESAGAGLGATFRVTLPTSTEGVA